MRRLLMMAGFLPVALGLFLIGMAYGFGRMLAPELPGLRDSVCPRLATEVSSSPE